MTLSTFEEHMIMLESELARIKEAGLTVNREKSAFERYEVKYLGVLVNRDGFRPDPDKIAPVIQYPEPNNLKQLRRFLGIAWWYRKFLPDFATIADPLTRLTKKNFKYVWEEEQQRVFEHIKALVASAPVLHRPDFNSRFVIQTDASDSGLGAVLFQVIDGQERVLEFASRALTGAERNFSVTKRECLAVLWAIEKFRTYVEGYHFLAVTEHSNLRWIRSLRSPTGRLARWAFRLQMHNFDVEHTKGSLNCVPDTLSRMFEDDEEEEIPVVGAVSCATTTKDEWYLDW